MFPLAIFNLVIDNLEQRYSHLARGQILSSPAIEYKGRAFAFCQKDNMIIKYHDREVLINIGIRATQDYRPFTNRVSFSQWCEVPFYYHADWTSLAEMALDALKDEID